MINDGKVFPLTDNTTVVILDLNWGFDTYVRVTSGPHTGKEGWLNFQRLKIPENR